MMTDWHSIPDLERQVALAQRALARAWRVYGERSLRYADKLGELRYVVCQATRDLIAARDAAQPVLDRAVTLAGAKAEAEAEDNVFCTRAYDRRLAECCLELGPLLREYERARAVWRATHRDGEAM